MRVLVVLEARTTLAQVGQIARRVDGFGLERRFTLVPVVAAEVDAEQIDVLASLRGVDHVELDAPVYAALDSAQQSFGVAQGRIDAAVDGDGDSSQQSYSKDDLVVAVLDSGISTFHRDLDEGKVIAWADFVNGLDVPYDDHGHGTSVASVVAGEGDARADRLYQGVAPGAALVGVKVLDRRGIGTVADVLAGLQWVVAVKELYGIEVANLSLEQPGCSAGTDALSLAVDAAHDAGLVVVVAAGNSGPGKCTIGSPGAAVKAITVGAMADLGAVGFKQAAFSSRGPTLDGRIKPDLSAPGVALTSAAAGTFAGYTTQSGTSLAAPFVAGLALLALDANPLLDPQDVADTLEDTAVDWGRGGDGTVMGSRGPDVDYGAGRLDGYATLEAAAGRDLGRGPTTPGHMLLEGELAGTGEAVAFPLDITDTSVPLAATLILPSVSGGQSSSPDFDLSLTDPHGTEVASATSSRRQDELGFAPSVPGRYVLRVRSLAGSGSFFVDVSAGLPVLPAEAPAAVEAPVIIGTPRQGSTLTSTDGVWTGTLPLVLARRWQRCDESGTVCTDIAGTIEPNYLLRAADVGARVRVVVHASNGAGTIEAASEASPAVSALPPLVVASSARALGHRIRFTARTLHCRPCRVEARIRVHGHWMTVRMRRAAAVGIGPGRRWSGVLRGVPSGQWAWRVRAVALESELVARSKLRWVRIPRA